jgi:hypothetical protein
VITVVVYGRNDAHGYNLHRRAALSLNCIAEVLTDPDDEIVFVDYNTPDPLPTFVEALADTLTPRCLGLLRTFRVPAALHEQRFAARTHLRALEPVARNAGVRRANPSNRWILSTNTDMIFLPLAGRSLSEICDELEDGFYGLPRFELPEWLWERLPRSDPGRAMADIERLGPRLRLDEITLSTDWVRFDAPGDFQLILREDYFAIDGLDEEMLVGYHVDSNLCKRMVLRRGSIESLEHALAGYHCNHSRDPTVYHGAKPVENDPERFMVAVDRSEIPAQRPSWGLADVELEEVPVGERTELGFAEALATAIPTRDGPRTTCEGTQVPYGFTYDSGHVLPFIADSLVVSPPVVTIGYVGANPVLERMLAAVVNELGLESPLLAAAFENLSSVEQVARSCDVLVVDFGLDASLVDDPLPAGEHEPMRLPPSLEPWFDALDRIIELERDRLESGGHPRRFVLVHSWTVYWNAYVLANLDCSHTTSHSRVRRATVRPVPADDGATRAALVRERRLLRWTARGEPGQRRLRVRVGESLGMADLSDYGGFADGWTLPDERGIWTQGPLSKLALALDGGAGERDYVLALSLGSICVAPDGSLRVEALVDGERVGAHDFSYGDPEWYLELPARGPAQDDIELAFAIDEPGSPMELGWSEYDDRRLGILLHTVTLLPADDDAAKAGLARQRRLDRWAARGEPGQRRLHVPVGEAVGLVDLSDYGGFGDGWVYQDGAGIWTEGSRSQLALALDGVADGEYALRFSFGSICVGTDSSLRVKAMVDGERADVRELRYGDPEWRVVLPAPAPADGEVDLLFEIEEPNSPFELGWSADERRLGVLLRAVTLEEVDPSVRLGEKIVFSEGSGAQRFLGEGWSELEGTGIWTDGEQASLVIRLTDAPTTDIELVLAVSAFVTADHPELKVEAWALGEQVAARVFRQGEAQRLVRIPWPEVAGSNEGRRLFELRLFDPASPVDLGLGDDDRRLGLHLEWLTVRKRSWSATLRDVVHEKSANLRSRFRRRSP